MDTHDRTASLAPIFVALLSLLSISLFGFAVAFWPQEPDAAASKTRDPVEARTPYEGSSFEAPPAGERRKTWT